VRHLDAFGLALPAPLQLPPGAVLPFPRGAPRWVARDGGPADRHSHGFEREVELVT
jgi:hypothetical protein